MSGFSVTSDAFRDRLDELCKWVHKHLHIGAVDDAHNAIQCSCVEWTKCEHVREVYRRLEKWQNEYEKDLKEILKHIDAHIITAVWDYPNKELDGEVRDIIKKRMNKVKTFIWVKKNLTPWELSQIRIRIFGESDFYKLGLDDQKFYSQVLDEIARFHKWEDVVPRM
jgi:GTP:adenosylcobinamide-phosphate guanylyltransferase